MTAEWRRSRARSSGVRFGSVKLRPSISEVGGATAADGGGAAVEDPPPAPRRSDGPVVVAAEVELEDDDS